MGVTMYSQLRDYDCKVVVLVHALDLGRCMGSIRHQVLSTSVALWVFLVLLKDVDVQYIIVNQVCVLYITWYTIAYLVAGVRA
jgi:hypothetical protein